MKLPRVGTLPVLSFPRSNESVPYLSLAPAQTSSRRWRAVAACKTLAKQQSAARAAHRVVLTLVEGQPISDIFVRASYHEPRFTIRKVASRKVQDCSHSCL